MLGVPKECIIDTKLPTKLMLDKTYRKTCEKFKEQITNCIASEVKRTSIATENITIPKTNRKLGKNKTEHYFAIDFHWFQQVLTCPYNLHVCLYISETNKF